MKFRIIVFGLWILAAGCSNAPEMARVSLEFNRPRAGLTIKIDGNRCEMIGAKPTVELAEGNHLLEVSGERYEPVRQQFDVIAGQDNLVRIDLKLKRVVNGSNVGELSSDPEETDQSGSESQAVVITPPSTPELVSDSSQLTLPDDDHSPDPNTDEHEADEPFELTPREKEVATWVKSVGGTLMKGDGLGVILRKNAKISDVDFKRFQNLPHLHSLHVRDRYDRFGAGGRHVSDEAILQLENLPALRSVTFGGKNVTDKSLRHLARFPIEELVIFQASITDEGVIDFSKHDLKILTLNECYSVEGAGWDRLDLLQTEELVLRRTSVSDRALEKLRGNTSITVLNVGKTKVSGRVCEVIGQLTTLQRIDVGKTPLADGDLFHLPRLTGLRFLGVGYTKVTADGLQFIASSFKNLTELDVSWLKIDPARVIDWSQLQNLKTLAFYGNTVGDAQLRSFAVMKNLTNLKLEAPANRGWKVTRQGLVDFKAALPKCKINGKNVDELLQSLSQK